MTTAYQWATGFPAPKGVSARVAALELERIRKAHKGALRPEMVVEASRNRKAQLHGAFEWDDGKAAEKWRLKQARDLIGAVVTVESASHSMSAPVRAYANVRSRAAGSHYTSTAEAMSDAELRQQLLDGALAEIQSWRIRYERLKELARIHQAIDETRAGITKTGQTLLKAA